MITQKELKELFRYDPGTGEFWWIEPKKGRRLHRPAGCRNTDGYIRIGVHCRYYQAHHLAWLYTYGKYPEAYLDHINGERADNRISNLREATHSQNQHNSKTPSNCHSGIKGVSWDRSRGKWSAQIKVNYQRVFRVYCNSKEEAARRLREARELYHGAFAKH